MASLRAIPRASFALILSALIIAAAISFGAVYTARGVPADTTFYACLYAGSLSQVGTTPPSNCGRGEEISWNSQGVAGLPGISGFMTESQVGASSGGSAAAGGGGDFIVGCPDGRVPIGNGYRLSGADPESVTVTIDRAIAADANNPFGFPVPDGPALADLVPDPYGWQFGYTYTTANSSFSVEIDVYCAYVETSEPA